MTDSHDNFPTSVRLELAALAAEYVALAHSLKDDSPRQEFARANELSLLLAVRLPEGLQRAMSKAIATPDEAVNPAEFAKRLRFWVFPGGAADGARPLGVTVLWHAPKNNGGPA